MTNIKSETRPYRHWRINHKVQNHNVQNCFEHLKIVYWRLFGNCFLCLILKVKKILDKHAFFKLWEL